FDLRDFGGVTVDPDDLSQVHTGNIVQGAYANTSYIFATLTLSGDPGANEVTNEEIYLAIKDMLMDKARGVDGYPIEFFNRKWEVV
ncbi:hypothetical protein HAX54_032833, partial [Datura stramonium]|nr:hypothetical protein [Datura stramonium]